MLILMTLPEGEIHMSLARQESELQVIALASRCLKGKSSLRFKNNLLYRKWFVNVIQSSWIFYCLMQIKYALFIFESALRKPIMPYSVLKLLWVFRRCSIPFWNCSKYSVDAPFWFKDAKCNIYTNLLQFSQGFCKTTQCFCNSHSPSTKPHRASTTLTRHLQLTQAIYNSHKASTKQYALSLVCTNPLRNCTPRKSPAGTVFALHRRIIFHIICRKFLNI